MNFESLKIQMKAWDDLGVMVKPHFATAYPGSECLRYLEKKLQNSIKVRRKTWIKRRS